MTTFEMDGMVFGRPEAEALREALIQLRDASVQQGNMAWAVNLSHGIALLTFMTDHIWPPEEGQTIEHEGPAT